MSLLVFFVVQLRLMSTAVLLCCYLSHFNLYPTNFQGCQHKERKVEENDNNDWQVEVQELRNSVFYN